MDKNKIGSNRRWKYLKTCGRDINMTINCYGKNAETFPDGSLKHFEAIRHKVSYQPVVTQLLEIQTDKQPQDEYTQCVQMLPG